MFPFINLGWIPGYLQTCEMLRRRYAKQHSPSMSQEEYFAKVMKYVDMHPQRQHILSDLHAISKIMADNYDSGKCPEECYANILDLIDN